MDLCTSNTEIKGEKLCQSLLIRKNQQSQKSFIAYIRQNLVFNLTSDGSGYSVSAQEGLSSEHIIIPDMYEGKPVVSIAKQGFSL